MTACSRIWMGAHKEPTRVGLKHRCGRSKGHAGNHECWACGAHKKS